MVRFYSMYIDTNKHPLMVQEAEYDYSASNMTNPKAIADMVNSCFQLNERAEEHLVMLALDAKCNVIGVFEVAHGAVNKSIASPREVYMRALICGAVNIVLVHNHPSGSVEPSLDDRMTCDKLASAGEIVGVHLIDFIIVGDNEYYSFNNKEPEQL